jgi:hypothetical protein
MKKLLALAILAFSISGCISDIGDYSLSCAELKSKIQESIFDKEKSGWNSSPKILRLERISNSKNCNMPRQSKIMYDYIQQNRQAPSSSDIIPSPPAMDMNQ